MWLKHQHLNFVLFIGTESETKAFMAVCIETAKRYNLDDYRTPVFIFERLCSIIYPVSYRYLGAFSARKAEYSRTVLENSVQVRICLHLKLLFSPLCLGGKWGDRVLCDPGERSSAGGLSAGPHARKPLQQQRAWHWPSNERHQEQDLPRLWPGGTAWRWQWHGGKTCITCFVFVVFVLAFYQILYPKRWPLMPVCVPQLLVNNKIISLDLSVAEVYKKVWCPTNEVRVLVILTMND